MKHLQTVLRIVMNNRLKGQVKMLNTYKVVEKFTSINGEGKKAGQLAVFIRFAGCNLNCIYCDTRWANEKDVPYTLMTSDEIYNYIKETGIKNVTLTGGEPLLQEGIMELLLKLSKDNNLYIEIETNGSIDIKKFRNIKNPPSFTIDYKLDCSGMESKMCMNNYYEITQKDTVKFVAGSTDDLNKAKEIIDRYDLTNKTSVYISPVFGKLAPEKIVEFMIDNRLNNVNLQIQMHKVIWAPDQRGV